MYHSFHKTFKATVFYINNNQKWFSEQ